MPKCRKIAERKNERNRNHQLARDIRVATLKSLNHLGFGHYGGSMSVVETLAVLYGAVDENRPCRPGLAGTRLLRTVESHAGPALYSTLAIKGYFPREELNTLNQNGTRLPSHPDRLKNARRGRHDRLTGTGHLYCWRYGAVA
ncbi:transketolase N-terminal section [Salmonella enterica subsp. enterica]|nr:transketolase N-terminal section [Salmonella enterica subsp. enterica]